MYYQGRATADGSTTVTGVNTLWTGRVLAGQKFMWLDDESTQYTLSADAAAADAAVMTGAVTAKTIPSFYIIDDNASIKKNFNYVKHASAFDWLYTIYCNDPARTILRFTDRPSNSAAGWEYPVGSGEFYLPRGVTFNSVTRSTSSETTSVEIVVESLDNVVYDLFTVQAFRRALIVIQGISNWSDTDFNSILFKGQINSAKPDDDEVKFLLSEVDDALKIQVRTCGQECQFGFWWDTRCDVNPDFKNSRPATDDNGNTDTTADEHRDNINHATYDLIENPTVEQRAGVLIINNTVTNGVDATVKDTDYWDFSEVMLLDDAGTLVRVLHGVDWEKTGASAGELTLRMPLRTNEVPNSTDRSDWQIELRRDCNRTWNHCTERHDNQVDGKFRFGGFKDITDSVLNLGSFNQGP